MMAGLFISCEDETGGVLDDEQDDENQLMTMWNVLKALDQMDKVICEQRGLPSVGMLEALHNTIADEELFASPPPRPDCPICCLPMSLTHTYQPCCGKNICDGCIYAHKMKANKYNCPFCRHPMASTNDERFKLTKKRMACHDSDAFVMMGGVYYIGTEEIKQDARKAVALWEKAVELGSELAHYYLGVAYANGEGVERDGEKAMYHWRLAAISGIPMARYNLGQASIQSKPRHPRQVRLAVKHFLIGAEAGHDESLAAIRKCYEDCLVDKEVFEKALRAHKSVSDEMSSKDRVAAHKERAELRILGGL